LVTASHLKRCPRCTFLLPRSEFGRNRSSHDGRHSYCKPCRRTYERERWEENPERDRERHRRYRRRHPDRVRERIYAQRRTDPRKYRAVVAVAQAVAAGLLIRPEVCPECHDPRSRVEAHHSSYEREDWLKVQFVCTRCHRRLHKLKQRTAA
jgi:hypothetical protein